MQIGHECLDVGCCRLSAHLSVLCRLTSTLSMEKFSVLMKISVPDDWQVIDGVPAKGILVCTGAYLHQALSCGQVPARIEKLIAEKRYYAAVQLHLQSISMLDREGIQSVSTCMAS
jgi:hypothetical protein